MDARVREATVAELPTVMGVLEGAMLEVGEDDVRTVLDGTDDTTDGVLVAVREDRVLGALVLEGGEVTAIAVRPGRRGQGIGSELVDAAAARVDGALTASFDEDVRAFYETLGFDVEPAGSTARGTRYRGRLE